MRTGLVAALALAAPLSTLVAQSPRPLTFGQPASSAFGASDPLRGGRPYQVWAFRVTEPKTLQLEMTSNAMDSYLVLQDSSGVFIKADDNGGGGRNARVTWEAVPGSYRVIARAAADTTGEYTIKLSEPAPVVLTPVVDSIRRGQEIAAQLGADDPKTANDRPYKAYGFTGNAGDSITVELRSDAFDTIVRIQDENGQQLGENDDADGELNSRLVFRIPRAGHYRIIATAFDQTPSGRFTLRVR